MKQKVFKYLFVLPLILLGFLSFSQVWGSSGSASITVTAPSSGSATLNINVNGTDHFSGSAITSNQITLTINTSSAPTPTPTVTLTANPTDISVGNASNLTWTVANATACTSNGTTAMPAGNWSTGGSGTVSTGALSTAQVYTYGLNCTGGGNSASASVQVAVSSGKGAPGVCGSKDSNCSSSLNSSSSGLCSSGTVTNFSGGNNGPWSWTCAGSSGGGNSSCGATYCASGTPSCGSANDGYVTSAPSSGLCSGGGGLCSPPGVYSNGPAWGWSCGTNPGNCSTGTTVACQVNHAWPVCTVSPSSNPMNFAGTVGDGQQYSQTFVISNNNGEGATLDWTASTTFSPSSPTNWFNLNSSSGSLSDGSSKTVTVRATTGSLAAGTYNATTTLSDTEGITCSTKTITVKFVVVAQPAVTVSLTANPTSTTLGNTSTLSWTVANATSCTSNGTTAMPAGNWSTGGSGTVSTGALNSVKTYSYGLSCTGPGLSGSSSASVVVNPPAPSISLSPTAFIFTGTSGGSTPAGQTLAVGDPVSGSTLNWKATTNQSWCFVNGSSSATGSTAGGGSTNLTVTVGAPSNVGDFNCTVTVADNGSSPAASNSPQTASVSYNVSPAPPDGGGGGTITATANSSICPATGVQLTWTAGSGDNTYNVYRNNSNTTTGATKIASGLTGLNYTDSSAAGGTNYYYWVSGVNTASGLESSQAPANTNASGGIAPNTCSTPPNPPGGPPQTLNSGSGPGGTVACGTIQITWSAPSGGVAPTGYAVFRNTTNNSATATNISGTLSSSTFFYTDATPGDPVNNYYWVEALNGISASSPSGPALQPTAINPCSVKLNDSDKNIIAQNGTPIANVQTCQNPPNVSGLANINFQVGDIITFAIDICNDQGTADAKGVTISDQWIYLQKPAAGYQATLSSNGGAPASFADTNFTVTSGSFPNQTITISNIPNVTAGKISTLTFKGQLAVPNGFNGTPRFQNVGNINFTGGGQNFGTPILPFSIGGSVPIIKEVP